MLFSLRPIFLRLQGQDPSSPKPGSFFLKEITLGLEEGNNIRFRKESVDKFSIPAASSLAFCKFSLANSRSGLSWICFCSKSANRAPSSQDLCGQKPVSRQIQSLVAYQAIKFKFKKVLRLLPNQTFNSSLGDRTQWVHAACPHWFSDFSIDLVRLVGKKI